MSAFSQKSSPSFNTAANTAADYDLAHMIAVAYLSVMDQDCQIEFPRAEVGGDEDEGFTLSFSSFRPLDRDEQMGLLQLDHQISDGINDIVAGGYPAEYDVHERVVTTPNIEVLIALLSAVTRYSLEPAITVPELLDVQSKGASAPAMRLN